MKAVIYYRLSDAEQEASALDLEAQQAAVEAFCLARGLAIVAPPYVETQEHEGRLELEAAIRSCQQTRALLVVATLEHLSRNALFLLTLRDSGVSFVAADMPDANNLAIGIMELVAQQERELIAMRTKAGRAAAKAYRKRAGAALRRREAARRQRQRLG